MPVLLSVVVSVLVGSVVAVYPVVDVGYRRYRGQERANGLTEWLGIQYAAPPVGDLRFAAPEDPSHKEGVEEADEHGPVCLRTAQHPDFEGTSEDCLYLYVTAPSNATSESNLPVWVYFQGGAFNANTKPHINASTVIGDAAHDMIFVNFNYRVGLYGFLTNGDSIKANNGLRDQRKVLEWVQKHISKFGGDAGHVVIGGGSAGAASVIMHLTADGGKDHGLFHGAIAQSASLSTKLTIEKSQYQYDNLAMRMGCAQEDSLACLRSKTAKQLQERNTFNLPLPYAAGPPLYQWLPVIDGEFIPDYTYSTYKAGKVVRVPTIIGDDTNGGTDFAPRDASSVEDSNLFMVDQYPSLTPELLGHLNELYPNSNKTCPAEGCFWRQAADVYGDTRFMCPALFMAATLARLGEVSRSYAYRYNVEDPDQMAEELGVPHTVENDAIFGEFDEDTPASYGPGGINEDVGRVLRGYWTSFVRTLNPNIHRVPGSARWAPWGSEGKKGRKSVRLEFATGGKTRMEVTSREQERQCKFWTDHGDDLQI